MLAELRRRDWLTRLAFSAASAPWPRWAAGQSIPTEADWAFRLGVASGSPSADGMVLWTRLTLPVLWDRTDHLPDVAVRWELAQDESFRQIVQRGTVQALAELGHSVRVHVSGLQPGRVYHYRFLLPGGSSTVGTTRTLPAADERSARLRLAIASCQRWEHGHYAAWRHAVAQAPDLVLFVGDYIYEYASPRTGVNAQGNNPIHRVHPLRHARTLQDYRDRYALHRSDPALQAAHAACPWVLTWDDHEVANDYAGQYGGGDSAAFVLQRAAAYQAYFENMPLPPAVLIHGLAGLTQPEALRLYQRYAWGRLAQLHVLDDRQYRAVQACRSAGTTSAGSVRDSDCPVRQEAGRSLLGASQEHWLSQGLQQDARQHTQWSVLAQQTLFSPRNYREGARDHDGQFSTDSWDGYPAARQRLLDTLGHASPRNTVLLGGDIHQHYVCDVKANPDDATSRTVASEFCGTSITSHSGASQDKVDELVRRWPHVKYARSDRRGYLLADITPAQWTTTLWSVDDPAAAQSPVSKLAQFVVSDGRPGPERIS